MLCRHTTISTLLPVIEKSKSQKLAVDCMALQYAIAMKFNLVLNPSEMWRGTQIVCH